MKQLIEEHEARDTGTAFDAALAVCRSRRAVDRQEPANTCTANPAAHLTELADRFADSFARKWEAGARLTATEKQSGRSGAHCQRVTLHGDLIEMNEMGQEDWLDRRLQDAAPYIDDEGFTAQVLKRLPARRRARRPLRAVILLGITLLASVIAYFVSDGGRFVSLNVERLATLPVLWLFAIALGSGLLVTTLGLFAAISKTRDLQS